MTDLFKKDESKDDDKAAGDKPVENNQDGTIETYLGLILNDEGKQKYSTPEEALKGSVHAQSHIANLEAELKTLRANDDKSASMEKIIKALQDNKGVDKDDKTVAPVVTEEALGEMLTGILNERESVSARETNVTTVTSVFSKLYGDKASETMYGKANDLGFSKDEINQLIATNPQAAMKVLGVESVKPVAKDVTIEGGVNSAALNLEKGEPEVKSSMGYISSKELDDNFKASQARTLKRLGVVIENP